MIEILTAITALAGAPGLFRAVVGLGRGAPSAGDDERRLGHAVRGGSLVAIAVLVAAPLGLFGAIAGALALAAGLAWLRPHWMVPGTDVNARRAAAGYGAIAVLIGGLGLTMPTGSVPADASMETALDIVAFAILTGGRAWLWFARPDAPFRRGAERLRAAADRAGGGSSSAWWDRAWARRGGASGAGAGGDASFADAAAPADDPPPRPDPEPQPEPEGPAARAAAADPAAADAALRVPGYDPALLAEELVEFRTRLRLIDRVAVTWPSHPVSEALIHVSVILNETRRFLQDHPDKYRDLRPILVGHAATAADIARLVDRIKGTGEALDDAEGVANRLFALAGLMRETRRRSTQAERDRLKASMAVIDDELSALSAVRDLRARMAAGREEAG